MNNLFVTIVLGSMAGTGLIELLIKLFLSDWLKRRYYQFQLSLKDKRECADQILVLIGIENQALNWKGTNNIKAYDLSDRLLSIGQKEARLALDDYSSRMVKLEELVDKMFNLPMPIDDTFQELSKTFLDESLNQDNARKKLVQIAEKLKK